MKRLGLKGLLYFTRAGGNMDGLHVFKCFPAVAPQHCLYVNNRSADESKRQTRRAIYHQSLSTYTAGVFYERFSASGGDFYFYF